MVPRATALGGGPGGSVLSDPGEARSSVTEPNKRSMTDLLTIEGLRTTFHTQSGEVAAVDGVDLSIARGRTLGIVGESGCGKSVLSLSIMRLVPPPGRIAAGRIMFDGRDLAGLPAAEMRAIRGGRIAMIFQEPMTSLNPAFTIGDQIIEAMRAHDRACLGRSRCAPARSRRWSGCGSPPPRAGSMNIRIKCPAACASG